MESSESSSSSISLDSSYIESEPESYKLEDMSEGEEFEVPLGFGE